MATTLQLPDVDKILKVLANYNGRDKAIRTIYFSLIILSTKIKNAELAQHIFALAKQLSLTRLVLRQLNHLPLLTSVLRVRSDLQQSNDKTDTGLNSTVGIIYAVQSVVEFGAWIADAKLIALDAAKWFRWALYLWIAAMFVGLLRLLRRIFYLEPLHDHLYGVPTDKKKLESRQADRITFVGLGADFIAGVSTLPHKFLWAGHLSKRTSATLSLVASVVGLYKCF